MAAFEWGPDGAAYFVLFLLVVGSVYLAHVLVIKARQALHDRERRRTREQRKIKKQARARFQ